jgi:choline dehydrogenase
VGYEYIVVGSGAGGGPLAANLARCGSRVLLLEAGSDPETYLYQVPCFHADAAEEETMAWNYFVHHYSENEKRDPKYRADRGGVFYPRAGTLGGCTAHNAMMTVVPHDSDWDRIAELTGDRSWQASNMRQYFQRLERCAYVLPPPAASGHGSSGWLSVSTVDPIIAIGDLQIARTVIDAALHVAGRRWSRWLRRIFRFLVTGDDPNDVRNKAANLGVTTTIPLATAGGRRNGTREFIRAVQGEHPDRLTVRMNTLAARVMLDGEQRAVGVECLEGRHLYRADPNSTGASALVTKQYRCSREVILAGGAFNTPQLLMLSGIGPRQHLEEKGIPCRVDRPGVGSNLQDRYEVAVVSTMKRDFQMLSRATFAPPRQGEKGDPCFLEWLKGEGVYTSNGVIAAVIMKSSQEMPDPDLFIFGLPGNFTGYYPGYSRDIERSKNFLTWAIVKAHTNNTSGTVRLKSKDPRDTPDIHFRYFEEGNDPSGEDLGSLMRAIEFVRGMNDRNAFIEEEKVPGRHLEGDRLARWITDNAWGHHASCSCPMGRADDPMAVVDSRFRVIGTKRLRVVDASVFPRIPGFFIVTPIYMVSEKAADTILFDRAA